MSKAGQIPFLNIVAAGSKNPQTGRSNGGVYFKGYQKPGGDIVPARWEGNFFINSFGTKRDAAGNPILNPQNGAPVPLPNKVVRLTAWNGRNSQPGKGLADLMAKCISIGKQMSCMCMLNIYDANVRDKNSGVVLQYSDGTPITTPRAGFTIIGGSFEFGNDSTKTVITEIQSWDPNNPNMDIFFRRPPQWNMANTPDNQNWETLRALRQSQTHIEGNAEYGFARIASIQANAQVPQGITPQVAAAVAQQPAMAVPQPGMAVPQPGAVMQPGVPAVGGYAQPGMVTPQPGMVQPGAAVYPNGGAMTMPANMAPENIVPGAVYGGQQAGQPVVQPGVAGAPAQF